MSPRAKPLRSRGDRTAVVATFDVTRACLSRCEHCYHRRAAPAGRDLQVTTMLAGLARLRRLWGIQAALWSGGEPLLRLALLRSAMRLFSGNLVMTSAMVPIPDDLGCGVLVSVDGPRELHDGLRGSGAFERAMGHIRRLTRGTFALATTLTARSLDAIEALPELVEASGARGVLVGFAVGPRDDALQVRGIERDIAVDRLHRIGTRHPGVLLNPRAMLEGYRPTAARAIAESCCYRGRAVAFDPALRVKWPCTFGDAADCAACSQPLVVARWAANRGDRASQSLLDGLFLKRPANGA